MLYHTDSQKGQVIDRLTSTPRRLAELFNPPYLSVFETREQDPLDPNQQLVAPAWWSGHAELQLHRSPPSRSTRWPSRRLVVASGGVMAFEYFFHRLTEPLAHTGGTRASSYWDRGV